MPLRALGRLTPATPLDAPRFGAVLPRRPEAPEKAIWWAKVESERTWILGHNDVYGDCVEVGPANLLLATSTYTDKPIVTLDEECVENYSAITGFDPANVASDRGTNPDDMLLRWSTTGLKAAGALHKIEGFATVDHTDINEVKSALSLFCGGLGCFDLPTFTQDQNYLWMPMDEGANALPGSWGAHFIYLSGYDQYGLWGVSWGAPVRILWPYWQKYAVGAYAVLDPSFMTGAALSPADVPWDQMKQALAALR